MFGWFKRRKTDENLESFRTLAAQLLKLPPLGLGRILILGAEE